MSLCIYSDAMRQVLLMYNLTSGNGSLECGDDSCPHIYNASNSFATLMKIQKYLVPCIACLGTSTSVLTCAVLLRTHLRKKFYSHFLVGESMCSLGFLLTVLVNWMHDQGFAVFRVPGLCQVNVFCSHFFLFVVIWLSVISALLILLDLARSSPVRWMRSPGVSKVWVLGLSLVAFSFYSYKWWTHGLLLYTDNSVLCTVIAVSEDAMRVLTLFDHLLLLYLPSLAFLLFDLGLMACASCLHKRCLSTPRGTDGVYLRRRVEVLNMVVVNAVIYQLFVSPKAVSLGHAWLQGRWTTKEQDEKDDMVINRSLQLMFYMFFAVNPTIPFLVSRKFRHNALKLVSRGCTKSLDMSAVRPASPL